MVRISLTEWEKGLLAKLLSLSAASMAYERTRQAADAFLNEIKDKDVDPDTEFTVTLDYKVKVSDVLKIVDKIRR